MLVRPWDFVMKWQFCVLQTEDTYPYMGGFTQNSRRIGGVPVC